LFLFLLIYWADLMVFNYKNLIYLCSLSNISR